MIEPAKWPVQVIKAVAAMHAKSWLTEFVEKVRAVATPMWSVAVGSRWPIVISSPIHAIMVAVNAVEATNSGAIAVTEPALSVSEWRRRRIPPVELPRFSHIRIAMWESTAEGLHFYLGSWGCLGDRGGGTPRYQVDVPCDRHICLPWGRSGACFLLTRGDGHRQI